MPISILAIDRFGLAYNLIDHHQSPGFGMFNTFHISKDVDTETLVKTTIYGTAIGGATGQRFGVAGFEKEDVCTRILRT